MVMINDWIFHRKSIGQAHGPLHKFPPRHLVAEIYVVAYPPVQCFFDGKSNRCKVGCITACATPLTFVDKGCQTSRFSLGSKKQTSLCFRIGMATPTGRRKP